MPPLVVLVILTALGYAFLYASHDSSNIIGTLISSHALSPRTALGITAAAEFTGPFLFGLAVAGTIGKEILDPAAISLPLLLSALTGAIVWGLLTRWIGFPSSSSHALIGGLIGAGAASAGWVHLQLSGIIKVIISLFASPLIGFGVGFLMLRCVDLLCWNTSPAINSFFKKSQILTGIILALSHGGNDAQKSMGVITMALMAAGSIHEFRVPLWVMAACAAAIALGTLLGSWQLIRTVGSRFYCIRPVHGFTAQLASAAVIITSSLLGGPVSTTQVISSAILGVGASERLSKVRWQIAQDIAISWLLTMPITALLAAGVYLLFFIRLSL